MFDPWTSLKKTMGDMMLDGFDSLGAENGKYHIELVIDRKLIPILLLAEFSHLQECGCFASGPLAI